MSNAQDIIDDHVSETSVSFTVKDLRLLEKAGIWGRVMAVIGLTVSVLLALGVIGSVVYMMTDSSDPLKVPFIEAAIVYGIVLALFVCLNILLLRFSSNAISTARTRQDGALTKSLTALKKLMQIMAVLSVLYGCIVLLVAYANILDLYRIFR